MYYSIVNNLFNIFRYIYYNFCVFKENDKISEEIIELTITSSNNNISINHKKESFDEDYDMINEFNKNV